MFQTLKEGAIEAMKRLAQLILGLLSWLFGGNPRQQANRIAEDTQAAIAENLQAQQALENQMGPEQMLTRLVFAWCRAVVRDRPLPDLEPLGPLAQHLRSLPMAQIRMVADGGKNAARALLNDLPGMVGGAPPGPTARGPRQERYDADLSHDTDYVPSSPMMMMVA